MLSDRVIGVPALGFEFIFVLLFILQLLRKLASQRANLEGLFWWMRMAIGIRIHV